MRVLLSTYGGRGDVEPLVGLAAALRALGAEVRVCAPPDEDFAQRLAGVGVPLVPVGPSARALTTAAPPPSSLPRIAAVLIASQFEAVTAAAEGCDALVAAVVHHGGAGTTTTAARAGAPQVVVPQAADQPYWAGRVADLGIGVAHDGPTPTFESLSAALGGPDPRDPRTSDRRGRHDPHRRGDGCRDAADRRGQPRKAAGVRVNHPGSSSQRK